jgi:oligopeptide transport system substrate-binding protein
MLRLLSIPLGLVVLLTGSLIWSGGLKDQPRADFAFINRGDIYTLDLNQMSYMQDFRLTYGIREGLYTPESETLKPIPSGAVGYELSDDKRVWTFHLRPECRWSNGDPVRAQDYVFSWRRMLEEPGEYTYLFYYIRNAEAYEKSYTDGQPIDFKTVGIEAVDDLTFRVSLIEPVPYLLELVAFPIFYPRHEKSMEAFKVVLDEKTGHYSYRNEYTRPPHVVTNGPFVLKDWDFKVRLVLEKSPTYWDRDHVKCNRLEMVVNNSPLSQFLQYEAGAVDWMADVPVDLAPELKAKGRTDLRSSPAFATAFLTFLCQEKLPPDILNGAKNPLMDIRVRQALAMSIDKQFIVENITRMGELPARTYLPPDGTLPDFRWKPGPFDTRTSSYDDKEMRALLTRSQANEGPGLPYDVEKARKLLAEAGYPNGHGFPRLPIYYNTDSTARVKITQVLKNQWKQNLGIDIDIQGSEGKIYRNLVSKKQYAIAPVAWYGDYPDVSTFTDKYLSASLQNDADYRNPIFDDLCARAAKEPDATKRIELLSQAEHLLDTEVPIVPLYHYVNTTLSRDGVHGCLPNPRSVTIFKGVWVERR